MNSPHLPLNCRVPTALVSRWSPNHPGRNFGPSVAKHGGCRSSTSSDLRRLWAFEPQTKWIRAQYTCSEGRRASARRANVPDPFRLFRLLIVTALCECRSSPRQSVRAAGSLPGYGKRTVGSVAHSCRTNVRVATVDLERLRRPTPRRLLLDTTWRAFTRRSIRAQKGVEHVRHLAAGSSPSGWSPTDTTLTMAPASSQRPRPVGKNAGGTSPQSHRLHSQP